MVSKLFWDLLLRILLPLEDAVGKFGLLFREAAFQYMFAESNDT
jgi:hypothetical protein